METKTVDVSHLAPGTCTTCGNGNRTDGPAWKKPEECGYCGTVFTDGEHTHNFGLKVDGLQTCSGREYLGCTESKYDSQWGAGIFNDWPRGHHKPYGA